jgi:hypothetical protein
MPQVHQPPLPRLSTPPPLAATAVVPPHTGSGPWPPAQLRIARTRIALQELTALVQDIGSCPAFVRQAVCRAREAVLELQSLLQKRRYAETQESRHG